MPLPPQSCDHVLSSWLRTSCQVPHDHVVAIYNLSCWPPQKVKGEIIRESCKQLLPAKKTPSHLRELAVKAPCQSVPAWNLTAEIQEGTEPFFSLRFLELSTYSEREGLQVPYMQTSVAKI